MQNGNTKTDIILHRCVWDDVESYIQFCPWVVLAHQVHCAKNKKRAVDYVDNSVNDREMKAS